MKDQVSTVPTLELDRTMLEKYGRRVSVDGRLERRIVCNLVAHLGRAGYVPFCVYDGEEHVPASDVQGVMELVFNLAEAAVWFMDKVTGYRHYVLLVVGNGIDIVADYGMSPTLDKFTTAMDAFEPEDYA